MTDTYGIVFPGQGSQSVGMLKDISLQYREVKQTFDEASEVLGYDLWRLVQEGPAENLDKTMYTQPALLAASYAVWRIIQSHYPLHPLLLAGHSLGEYTALVCAQALTFVDALRLVAARGRFMQEAVQPDIGAMAAIIGLDEATVVEICQHAISPGEVLSPANFNSIGQIVIAGHKTAVLRAMTLAKEKGAKLTVLIPVSVPSHCQLMQPAAERLSQLLATVKFGLLQIPVINNVDVQRYQQGDSIRDGLIRQLSMPVRWVETIQVFAEAGVTHIIECGPGKILTGLNKRINKNLHLMTTSDVANLETLHVT
jgi:[acyl-carrier-protein] S-malonyltransferase